jgi:hypothetical protein
MLLMRAADKGDPGVVFVVRPSSSGAGVEVVAIFPDDSSKVIAGFTTEAAANDWIRVGSSGWLKRKRRRRR